ncbi:hypothetical protein J3F83DRAFT_628846 [Trichoderma novae-zelandiae]
MEETRWAGTCRPWHTHLPTPKPAFLTDRLFWATCKEIDTGPRQTTCKQNKHKSCSVLANGLKPFRPSEDPWPGGGLSVHLERPELGDVLVFAFSCRHVVRPSALSQSINHRASIALALDESCIFLVARATPGRGLCSPWLYYHLRGCSHPSEKASMLSLPLPLSTRPPTAPLLFESRLRYLGLVCVMHVLDRLLSRRQVSAAHPYRLVYRESRTHKAISSCCCSSPQAIIILLSYTFHLTPSS